MTNRQITRAEATRLLSKGCAVAFAACAVFVALRMQPAGAAMVVSAAMMALAAGLWHVAWLIVRRQFRTAAADQPVVGEVELR